MDIYTFDTLAQAQNLQNAGFSADESKGIVEMIGLSTRNLVTKQDLQYTIDQVKQDLHNEMRSGFAEVDKKFLLLDNKILRMTISLAATNVTAMGALAYLLQWANN